MASIVLFNKPYGVVCQFSAPTRASDGVSRCLKDYLPQRDVYPAGRLDADSEGLVVLTADGVLQHHISDPRHKLAKTYLAEVEGLPTTAALQKLSAGSINLGDFVTQPAQARQIEPPAWLWPRVPPVRFRKNIPTAWIEITLREGKNRQVRRMTAAVGYPTLRLIRYRIGEWSIAGLETGSWRELVVDTPRRRVERPAPSRLSTAQQRRR
jgi:23S rRNA pseudouridine2457 synthase